MLPCWKAIQSEFQIKKVQYVLWAIKTLTSVCGAYAFFLSWSSKNKILFQFWVFWRWLRLFVRTDSSILYAISNLLFDVLLPAAVSQHHLSFTTCNLHGLTLKLGSSKSMYSGQCSHIANTFSEEIHSYYYLFILIWGRHCSEKTNLGPRVYSTFSLTRYHLKWFQLGVELLFFLVCIQSLIVL